MRRLEERVAVVTGAASGIGRALAMRLSREGCDLAIVDIDGDGLAETEEMIAGAGANRISKYLVDVSKRDEMEALADAVVHDHGQVHMVVNNAGVALNDTVEGATFEDLEWIVGINLWGVVYGTKYFLPFLRQVDEGHIVNISSVLGFVSQPTLAAYSMTKYGISGFTEALRQELADTHIGVTCVYPGSVRTHFARNARINQIPGGAPPRGLAEKLDRKALSSADAVARRIIAAIRKKMVRVLIGREALFSDIARRIFPVNYNQIGKMIMTPKRIPKLIIKRFLK